MFIFALANKGRAEGFYIGSEDRATFGWEKLPDDLADEIEDVRQNGEHVEDVSVGLDGDWFLRTDARHACTMDSNVELFVQLVQEAGLTLADYAIQFFTFVPDPTGYVTVLHKTDGSLTRCAWHNVPPELDSLLEQEADNGVRHVAVGMDGSYVVILNTGAIWWNGVHQSLHNLLDEAERTGLAIVTVSLSLISTSYYFIEFADGTTNFLLPPRWHDMINRYTAKVLRSRGPRMTTSFNTPRSPSSLPTHYGSFNGVPRYGGIDAGNNNFAPSPCLPCTPFASNPYLASAFAPPPPQSVYNINYVYNNPAPQSSRKSSLQNYNGVFTFLGGALKLAGAVLGPGLGLGMGTGFGGF
ncbi:hypothetical protein F5148DRAFT_1151740 [Russula earlei]|uniref:Uncharacterized protein n=1 Tax=Russula earlei TaxID=71964 RepID=A0ACC0TZ55_9AGAM|nr:hypothetical protein F5148DRAFT_1151740 [Russula earlei]